MFFLSHTTDGVIALASDGTIQTWNPAAEKIYGYAQDEATGRKPGFLFADKSEIPAKLASRRHISGWQPAQLHRNGSPVHASLAVFPLARHGGRPAGHCIIARELRGRAALRRQLLKSMADEFNVWLTMLQGYISMIAAELPADRAEAAFAAEVRNSAARASALTNELLGLLKE